MGLQETDEVDIISYNNDNGVVTLGIIDTMDWNDIDGHLMLLQKKTECIYRKWRGIFYVCSGKWKRIRNKGLFL